MMVVAMVVGMDTKTIMIHSCAENGTSSCKTTKFKGIVKDRGEIA